jgi:2-desacetyl-2-hydroxyethyl bacteriochlorophyllide A dehydrogenase
MQAKAVVATAVSQVEVQEVELPDPGAGEVLFETRYSCISPGTEMRTLGGKQAGARFPLIPGYAMLGRVVRRGPGVTIEEGTLALLAGTKYAAGVNLCWGGHVSHAVADAERLFEISEDIDPIQAVAAKLASIAYHGLRLARPLPEENVAVIGLGCIGHCAAKLYAATGAHTVACDMSPKRVARATAAGLTAVVAGPSLRETFAEYFPHGADVVVDCTGAPQVLPHAIEVGRMLPWGNHEMRGPRLIIQGSYADGFSLPYDPAFMREMSLYVPRNEQMRDRTIVLELIQRGTLSLLSIISDVRKPEEAQATYTDLATPDTDLMTVVYAWT